MIKTIKYPDREKWKEMAVRPAIKKSALDTLVTEIINKVRTDGDKALKLYSREFDGINLAEIKVATEEIKAAESRIGKELKEAILEAKKNIEKFHSAQVHSEPGVETTKGVDCWRKNVPIERVGLYIPGGTAPLFSSVLMLAIPAKIAKCSSIVMCTPPARDGSIDPALLFTADICGINEIYKTGGAQAVAAMAYGTGTLEPVNKIFGPGNQYVTRAKQLVQLDGIAIDMPAGPSEVLVIADKNARPDFIASDLLSQAEHGTDSQVVLATDSEKLIEEVKKEVALQIDKLPRKMIAGEAISNSFILLLETISDCMEFSNLYAPEHLIISTENAEKLSENVINAGSVFIGKYSCESAGDYASGTNHTLPTNGYAKSYSGVSVDSFIKKITFQKITSEGILAIGRTIEVMAEAEKLEAHRNAVSIRLKIASDEKTR